ncbi:MAG: hypothetical protein A3J07_04005 [Candidatus Doudnabacteria bacterium RIFCSPLOWO2_02_FULL_49_13]|uniref:Adenylate kinase n=1 Tax=Candidatus Doudnabacteria bacterium RIFCSPHIGHO2_12_FULL_48_16 TaxID=1817838 RepID=A0A1F5PK58_9BACT|nr:MAG: hypothetical protein A3B77_02815 [Candidatus Doudnabacteria bacterium RIFCSPHIGHO2_02_FULL_49_24]OGE90080.1 MAG: hypothetical protein A3E29_03150 [Candidatus Doudnabacteria bacterium RIFCSPHIGHO2_12_FULL_48_16]OGE90448.1 MAG: hypothetical protein A2760_00790 [Candidatus Doudnabacteria bacterium RIFCSPHIGHO2_01_FULL_50_67]OGE96504.1 MAG: hypothetical protein A2990_04535 [Candidatus Doudnabacteria bacterium RIFCSPLOWO2_01_FULL_49_40]OGF03223.1 MAG: hypothetical protein A3J07_04005 [Candid
MDRIAIIGISASGKSVFGRELARKTGLPLIHMDQLFWQGNWQEVPEAEYLEKHQEIIGQDRWIIEGYIEESMADRLKRADQIVYLDYPGWLCTLRLIRRWFIHRRSARSELPKEALEKFKYDTFWKILLRKERIRIEQALRLAGNPATIRFKSPHELNEFLQSK